VAGYQDWGFWKNPFQPHALGANPEGTELLVGRDHELTLLGLRLGSSRKILTFEGVNGIGKTSLVNVGAYRLFTQHCNDPAQPLLVPCRRAFQLGAETHTRDFVNGVFLEVAQTLVGTESELRSRLTGRAPDALDRWLNSPTFQSISVGIGSYLSAGSGDEPNSGFGFESSGLKALVLHFLKEVFPEDENGGVVCTIDNLELVRTSIRAKSLLEELRDEVLVAPGLRWVVCGSSGIVHGAFSSPRMEGYFYPPIQVVGLEEDAAAEILRSRLRVFAKGNDEPYLPLTEADFIFVHRLFNGNLRATLGRCDDYCQLIQESGEPPEDDEEKRGMFLAWLQNDASEIRKSVEAETAPRALQVFDVVAEDFAEGFSPGDYKAFGCNSASALRPHVKVLEELGIVATEKDETDQRRRNSQLTPKGWLLRYARKYNF